MKYQKNLWELFCLETNLTFMWLEFFFTILVPGLGTILFGAFTMLVRGLRMFSLGVSMEICLLFCLFSYFLMIP